VRFQIASCIFLFFSNPKKLPRNDDPNAEQRTWIIQHGEPHLRIAHMMGLGRVKLAHNQTADRIRQPMKPLMEVLTAID
jgi:hypothetical protein